MTARPPARFFVLDAVHRFRSPFTPSLVSVLILAGATIAIFATTGIALASQQATVDRFNSPEGRLITVTDAQGEADLSSLSVPVVSSITGVEWALGVGPALDVTASSIPGGALAPARFYYGDLPPTISVTAASDVLAPGMAAAGPGIATTLGLGDGVGAVAGRGRAATVIGGFHAAAPLDDLNGDILVAADGDGRVVSLWVEVSDVSQLPSVVDAVRAAIIADNPAAVHIDTSTELAQLSSDISSQMARSAVLTVSALLITVLVLVGSVEYARVTGTVRDIGRRRALGATRSAIVIQVLATAGLSAVVGVVIGLAVGLAVTVIVAGALPGWEFALGVVVLMVVAALTGAVPPALRAARLDPVKILRVP